MNFKLSLNKYINLSDKWLTKFVLVWCSVSLVIGLYAIDDLALAIAAPLMTLFMYFAAMAMLIFVIGFQRINPFNSPNSKFVEYATIFFWGCGILGFISSLMAGIFQTTGIDNSKYFLIVASAFPLGIALGATKEWKKLGL
ncbi:hypothetical protein CW748_10700 [Alteromonadales bacterium alter-6D02]|nr:hypothetical protein CW748_10700 [Alteromonadales bacterium alter-6D02]